MVDCEFEGVAGYVENERATKCQQENERWQEVIFSIRILRHNGLMTDLGLCSDSSTLPSLCPLLSLQPSLDIGLIILIS